MDFRQDTSGKDLAAEYIQRNSLEKLLTEMLNSVVASQSKRREKVPPIVDMIRYLARISDPQDLELEKIKIDTKPEDLSIVPTMTGFAFPENTTALIKTILTNVILDKVVHSRTRLGGTISHIIQKAFQVEKKETIGIYATDGEAYTAFAPFYNVALNKFAKTMDEKHSLFDLPETEKYFRFSDSSQILNKLCAIRLRYARNLQNLPYIPYAKDHSLEEIKNRILTTIKKYEEGDFYNFDSPNFEDIEKKFFDREPNLFSSLNVNKDHSGIYLCKDQKKAYLVNFNDHLQIVVFDESNNIWSLFNRLNQNYKQIEEELKFDKHSEYGYLTSCPSNTGEGLKISSWVKISNSQNHGFYQELSVRWSYRSKMNQTLEIPGCVEIISKHKIGVPLFSFINSYIVKISSLIGLECNLESNPFFIDKKIETFKSNDLILESLYNKFFDQYKYVLTPNFMYFNSLFGYNEDTKTYSLGSIPDKEAYQIYRSFFFEYINKHTSLNMLVLSKKTDLKSIYDQGIEENILKSFDSEITSELNNLKGLKYTTLSITRNITTRNFRHSEQENAYCLKLIDHLVKKFNGGTVFTQENLKVLENRPFHSIFDNYLKNCNYFLN
jgi:protein-arginine kinase